MVTSSNKLLILYGSQTGTAQEVAERIWRESKNFGFNGPISAMDEYPINKLIFEEMVIFVCSTTGQGDQPNNMKKFWKFLLRKNLPSNSLQKLSFAVLGLGDSSYVKFNFVAKKLHRRLETLGGTSICEVGLADDQHDIGADAVVEPWLTSLWQTLVKSNSTDENIIVNLGKRELAPPRWSVSIVDTKVSPLMTKEKDNFHIPRWENTNTTKIISNERVTPESHFQDVRLVKMNIPPNLEYKPGDVLMVHSHNRPSSVKKFLEIMNERKEPLSPETLLIVEESNEYMPVPYPLTKPCTIDNLAISYLDLNATPKKYTFELLSHFTDNELEKEKLEEFISPEGQNDFYNYSHRPRRTILEVLSDFPHACSNIPVQYLFEIFTPIRPRAFSIASSIKMTPNEIHILVAVVKYKTKLFAPRYGLCSNYIASLKCSDSIVISIKNGSFIFPTNLESPIIMIGPGTGIAPFRSYIQTKINENNSTSDDLSEKLYLFFGCRNKKADFYFQEEWSTLIDQNQLNLFTAFSRDQDEKVYVQHVMKDHLLLLKRLLLLNNAYVFIAGNANDMPDAVKDVLIEAINLDFKNETAAKDYLEKMELTGRLQTETWA